MNNIDTVTKIRIERRTQRQQIGNQIFVSLDASDTQSFNIHVQGKAIETLTTLHTNVDHVMSNVGKDLRMGKRFQNAIFDHNMMEFFLINGTL